MDATAAAFADAIGQTVVEVQARAPRLTGEYSASLGVLDAGVGTPLRGKAASSVPRASSTRPEATRSGTASSAVVLSTPQGPSHLVAIIGSLLPQAGAVERGAWAKGRGPHMRGVGTLGQAGASFVGYMTAALRARAK
jgi:hypothetical protein